MIYNMYNTYNRKMFKETIRFSGFILFHLKRGMQDFPDFNWRGEKSA